MNMIEEASIPPEETIESWWHFMGDWESHNERRVSGKTSFYENMPPHEFDDLWRSIAIEKELYG